MTVFRFLGVLVAILILMVGAVFLYAGIQNYFAAEAQGVAFGTTTLGLAIFCLPLAVYFTGRARKSYKKSRSQYELPDTPLRFFMLMLFSAGFLLLSLVSILLYIVYMYS